MNRFVSVFALGAFLTACSDPELERRVQDLEAKVAALESRGPAAPVGAAPAANPEQEQAAAALLKEATLAVDQMEYDLAKEKVAVLKAEYGSTRAAKASARIEQELAIVGKPEAPLKVEKWYQGSEADAHGKATMYVFWEVWCPHCRKEVPRLTETYDRFHGSGLSIVGVTRQTKDVTDQQVTDFIRDNKVNYPIAKDASSGLSDYYGVRGIPAAAVVKDGVVVWRGHPAKVSDEMLNGWLGR
ncbi:MAG: TlpA family protein disulfide reductase [Alphaproteobacteria bacterium]|nr:TlpA family protein disulfide reductase [Alphaproteobacteria bacterium]